MSRFLCLVTAALIAVPCLAGNAARELFRQLDLDRPGLEKVKSCADAGLWDDAAAELLEYYRNRPDVKLPDFPVRGQEAACTARDVEIADLALEHSFYAHPNFPILNYGKDRIDWTYWPIKDVELRVGLHRHRFFTNLARAYKGTGDGKYAQAYVDIMRDWMKNNPYEPFDSSQQGSVSSGDIDVDAPNVYFVWRPLEITNRLRCHALQFEYLKDAEAFTPEFLVEFLSEYKFETDILDLEWTPSGNHRLYEAQGMLYASLAFPEFKAALRWQNIGIAILNEGLGMQVFPDGCHFEYCPSYHSGSVMGTYITILGVLDSNGLSDRFSPYSMEMIRRMLHYTLAFTYPDLMYENFSDARAAEPIRKHFAKAMKYYPDDEVIAWFGTGGAAGKAPDHPSTGYPDTGFYNLRSGWGGRDVSMAVKATRRGGWHAQPDFGTFGLWVAGKRLIQDASCYAYSGDENNLKWRAYFKQTARHSTLTLDDRDYLDPEPEVIAWKDEGPQQILSIQHRAYADLVHRRSIAFDGTSCYVMVDEVEGGDTGCLRVRYACGTEPVSVSGPLRATYRDGDAGFVIAGAQGPSMRIDRDWVSKKYMQKEERDVITFGMDRQPGSGVQRFISVLCTFSDGKAPVVEDVSYSVRKGMLEVRFKVNGKKRCVSVPTLSCS